MTPAQDRRLHLLPWFAIGLTLLLPLYLLAPILTPFVLAVGWRDLRSACLASRFYLGQQ